MSRTKEWLDAWFRVVGDTTGPEWNRHLFQWDRSRPLWLAVALFLGMMIVGSLLVLLVGNLLGLRDLSWLRVVFMATFLTAWWSVVRPFRQAVTVGVAMLAAQSADLIFRRTVTDGWPAWGVSCAAVVLATVLVIRLFNLKDALQRSRAF